MSVPSTDWFDSPTLGAYSPYQLQSTLAELEAEPEAATLSSFPLAAQDDLLLEGFIEESYIPKAKALPPLRGLFQEKIYLSTSHLFGFIPPNESGSRLPIFPLNSIQPDASLQGERVCITLDCLRIASYPGRGTHKILIHFFAHSQLSQASLTDFHFSSLYRVRQGEQAAVRGYPVFVGLEVGQNGLRLRCRTVNVCNSSDETLLQTLESDTFRQGLNLVEMAVPVIQPFSAMMFSVAKAVASRHQNVSVQDIDLGLDFSRLSTGARLAEGSYVVLQVPDRVQSQWDWADWRYLPGGQIVRASESVARENVPYNYMVLGVRRFEA